MNKSYEDKRDVQIRYCKTVKGVKSFETLKTVERFLYDKGWTFPIFCRFGGKVHKVKLDWNNFGCYYILVDKKTKLALS